MAALTANENRKEPLILQSSGAVALQRETDDAGLNLLLDKLYYEKGYDFRGYKKTSLRRRISRRMRLNNIESIEGYAGLLDQSTAEYQKLFNDLTIKVTGFFRDGYPFYILRDIIMPDIISMKQSKQSPLPIPLPQGEGRSYGKSINSRGSVNLVPPPLMGGGEGEGEKKCFQGKDVANEIRVWSPGCATGEEPYSIAMLLMDVLKDDADRFNIKIFATDISEDAVESARLGIYHPSQLEGMKKEYIDAYFVPSGSGHRIKYSIRQMVRYGIHNLVTHQPISHLDLILCRNVLIYFDRELQENVFRDFYYALRPKGYLVLGKSEVILSEKRDAFREINREARVYQKV